MRVRRSVRSLTCCTITDWQMDGGSPCASRGFEAHLDLSDRRFPLLIELPA